MTFGHDVFGAAINSLPDPSNFQTEVLFHSGPDGRVRETCEDGQLPPRRTIFVTSSDVGTKPDGMDEWLNENCVEGSAAITMKRPKDKDGNDVPDWAWEDMLGSGKVKELPQGETGIKVHCNTCEESPWKASKDETEEGEDKNFFESFWEWLFGTDENNAEEWYETPQGRAPFIKGVIVIGGIMFLAPMLLDQVSALSETTQNYFNKR